MRIRNIKRLIAGVVFSVGMFGCTDLDENLYDVISSEKTKLTEDDLSTIIAAPFAQFRRIYWEWNGLFDIYEESSDLIVTPYRVGIGWGDLYLDMHKHKWGPELEHCNNLWVRLYAGIYGVNKAMFQIEALGEVEGKDKIFAELRALRAMYYYLLLDNFRNVPLVTKFDLPAGFLPEQSGAQEVYDFIEDELTAAMPLLSAESGIETYGRVTKWAAKMTLAKVYLNSEVYTGTARWEDAIAQVDDIIASGKFSLLSSYAANFAVENTNTSEEILSIPYSKEFTPEINSYYPFKTLHPLSAATFNMPEPWGGSCGIPQFIDTYDEDDSRLKECWLGGPQVTASGAPIMVNDSQFEYINYMTSVDAAEYNEGFRFIKYQIPVGFTVNPDNDVPFYRYADALMIKAECLLRTGREDEAATIVTELRARAFKAAPEKAVVTGADLKGGSTYVYGPYENGAVVDDGNTTPDEGGADIEFGRFLDELAWEFVGEHHRRQDLVRFDVYTRKSWLTKKASGDFRKVFPIPLLQRQVNPNLGQNDGY